MKALTLYQPWASAIAAGLKKIETRNWTPSHDVFQDRLAIHASTRWSPKEVAFWVEWIMGAPPECRDAFQKVGITIGTDNPPLGVIVATVRVIRCVPTHDLAATIGQVENSLGDFSPLRWGWVMEDVRPLKRPIRATGMQKIWEWTPPPDFRDE